MKCGCSCWQGSGWSDALGIARRRLDDEALSEIIAFVTSQRNEDGGFRGRSKISDLYYTSFALEILSVLDPSSVADTVSYLARLDGETAGLDIVHLVCLVRSLVNAGENEKARAVVPTLEKFRTGDSGYGRKPGSALGTIYDTFLAVSAYELAGLSVPGEISIPDILAPFMRDDGGFAGGQDVAGGTVPVTAAAILLQSSACVPIDSSNIRFLLDRADPEGGFRASSDAPIPDLLSTATALWALFVSRVVSGRDNEKHSAFAESMWDDSGGFMGSPVDSRPDCEYTFYGLLALGGILS